MTDSASDPADTPMHRSGAAARLAHVPVATLRVWERRYGLTSAPQAPGGQRLYSAADVQRLALLKRLTDLGHAIGSIASLDLGQLQEVLVKHGAEAGPGASAASGRATPQDAPPAAPWRVAVVGAALARRLQRPALWRQLGRAVEVLGPFDGPAALTPALQGAAGAGVDALLVQADALHDGWLAPWRAAWPQRRGRLLAVVYGFASEPVCDRLAQDGVALLRGPQPDAVLAQWLRGMVAADAASPDLGTVAPLRSAENGSATSSATSSAAPPPRRWDDAALASFTAQTSRVACECPRHVAELLMQLAQFEAYSAQCAQRNREDAALHADLQQVAASARAQFEGALERVAAFEGLSLPR